MIFLFIVILLSAAIAHKNVPNIWPAFFKITAKGIIQYPQRYQYYDRILQTLFDTGAEFLLTNNSGETHTVSTV